MGSEDKIAAVARMQVYISAHFEDEITLDDLAGAVGYSKYHAARIFKELTGQTPFDAIRALKLTGAARTLQDSGENVLDVALNSGFDSHDGFTRAFARRFNITPQTYRQTTPPVRWFIPHSIEAYYRLKEGTGIMRNEKVSGTVTVSTVERPARKIIFLRVPTATDYFAACEEVGCDWEGLLNSIPEKFDTAAGGQLPRHLVAPGTGGHAFMVEVPLGYDKSLPEGYEISDLPPCTYLYFCGMPFDDLNDFPIAIGILNEAMEQYPLEKFGWRRSDSAPELGMGTGAGTGARAAMPVERIRAE